MLVAEATNMREWGVMSGLKTQRSDTAPFWIGCGMIALFSLWLRTGFPVHAIPAARADDALFVALARHLVAGHWLGPFNNTTLVKGMFYPLFIAGAFAAGVPLKIAEQAVYLAAAALIAGLVRRLPAGRSWFAALVFCALALNPMMWTDPLARVIREGLYGALALAVIGCSILASFGADGHALPARDRPWRRIGCGILAGVVGGCFWLTREEGVWLVPAILCTVGVAIADAGLAWHEAGRPEPIAAVGCRLAQPWLAAALAMLAVVGAVATINARQYGVFEITEVQSPAFRAAYGALARIQPDRWQRFVVFPRDARIEAYRVSAAARELAPALDGPVGDAWRTTGCTQTAQQVCPEILGGWFQWALRDAAAAAGHYRTAATAATYYQQLANQINAACAQGTLRCLPPRATLAPPFRITYVSDALRTAPMLARILLHPEADGLGVSPSQGTPPMIRDFADFVGPVMPEADPKRWLSGWVSAAAGLPTLDEQTSAGVPIPSAIDTRPAPDVAAKFPGRQAVRFDLQTTCATCSVAITCPGAHTTVFALGTLIAGSGHTQPGLTIFVDQNSVEDHASTARRHVITRIAAAIATLYGALLVPACLLATLGLAAGMRRHHRAPPALIALVVASLVAVATRIALLSYLEVTAIPSVNALYASPAEPLLIVFAVVGCWAGRGRAS
jgi:hypothetical protein